MNRRLLFAAALLALAFVISTGGRDGADGGRRLLPPRTGKVAVLIVEETAERSLLPASQLEILGSIELRKFLAERCDVGADGEPQFRILDKDADVSFMAPVWKERFERSKSMPLPNIAISTGRSGAEGDLPLTVDEVKAIVSRYAGQ